MPRDLMRDASASWEGTDWRGFNASAPTSVTSVHHDCGRHRRCFLEGTGPNIEFKMYDYHLLLRPSLDSSLSGGDGISRPILLWMFLSRYG